MYSCSYSYTQTVYDYDTDNVVNIKMLYKKQNVQERHSIQHPDKNEKYKKRHLRISRRHTYSHMHMYSMLKVRIHTIHLNLLLQLYQIHLAKEQCKKPC